MKKNILIFLLIFVSISKNFSQSIDPINWPGMVGYWTFDSTLNVENATVGVDLELFGSQVSVEGYTIGDSATRIGLDSYYKCTHGISPNGGGSLVNEYSLLIDFKIPQVNQYYCFYQTNMTNSNDGEVFVNPSSQVGVTATDYSTQTLMPGEWYRLVIAVDLDNTFKYYIDGNLLLDGQSQSLDGRFSLDPFFHWFRDNNDEDNEFDVSTVAIFDYTLDETEVDSLSGFGHVFDDRPDPYLQTPTPNSIYVSWHSYETSNTYVQYGTSASLGNQTNGNYENISGMIWHTVQLTGLTADTEYFYRCISGTDTSEMSNFKTIHNTFDINKHVRFVVLGDSRTDINNTSYISQKAEEQLILDYGADWHNEINFVMQAGDIAHTDYISNYISEYFTPYANLSKKIPFMVSVGNHEYNGGALNYFKYMKYEDLTGFPYSSTSSTYNEKFYKFQIGNVLYIAINSNLQITEQTTWLQNVLDLAELDPEIDFIFPFNHHPGRSETWPDGNTPYIQNDILNLLKNYSKISMMSYGHSHSYERGIIELDSSTVNNENDMYILLSGGAGSHLDRWGMYPNQQDYPEIIKSLDHYNYSIVDIDSDNKTMSCKTYSLGHSDLPLNNELVDEWYMNLNQIKPNKPINLDIDVSSTFIELIAPTFSGIDSLMTSQFQLTNVLGDYSTSLIDNTRDSQNFYGDSGAPLYSSINLNDGIDLSILNTTLLSSDVTTIYGWRVRYRDYNLKWSEWSDEYIINDTTIYSTDSVQVYLTSCNPSDTGIVIENITHLNDNDTVITTITSLLPTNVNQINLTSCNPADTGIAVVTYVNQYSCDSIVTTVTSLLPTNTNQINLSSCNPADTGTTVAIFANQYSCDSVVTTITGFQAYDTSYVNSYTNNFSDTGVIVTNFTNDNGCDSVIYTHIILNEKIAIDEIINYYAIKINPNPVDYVTNISYNLRESKIVTIKIFNTSGQLIKILSDRKKQKTGIYNFTLNFKDLGASGLYYCNFNISGEIVSKPLLFK